MFLNAVSTLSVLVLGYTLGVASILAYGLYMLRKYDKKRQKFAEVLAKEAKDIAVKAESARDRINKAFDISQQQFDIMSGMEGPQSGPLHGKHKQTMNSELKRLEEEKIAILKSVLNDGYDPKFVIINDRGEKESIKLSEFINRHTLNEKHAGATPAPVEPKKRLSLVKNSEEK